MDNTDTPESRLVIESAEPGAVLAIPTRTPLSEGTTAEVEDLEEIMASAERLPVGLFPSELSTERDGVWVDGDGQPIRDEEEE